MSFFSCSKMESVCMRMLKNPFCSHPSGCSVPSARSAGMESSRQSLWLCYSRGGPRLWEEMFHELTATGGCGESLWSTKPGSRRRTHNSSLSVSQHSDGSIHVIVSLVSPQREASRHVEIRTHISTCGATQVYMHGCSCVCFKYLNKQWVTLVNETQSIISQYEIV